MTSTYLYCFASPACVPLVSQMSGQDGVGGAGVAPLRALECGGVVAVITDVDACEFNETNLQSLEWIGPRAYHHADVVKAIMSVSAVLPVKFGTLFESTASVTQLLAQYRAVIAARLEQLRGTSEWTVKGHVDEGWAHGHARAVNPALAARMAALSSASPGTRYLQEKQLAGLLNAALREWVEQQAGHIGVALQPHVVESAEVRLLPSNRSGDSGHVAFDRNFLVADAALPAFRAAFADLRKREQAVGLMLELKGPWPPYHFCPDVMAHNADVNDGCSLSRPLGKEE